MTATKLPPGPRAPGLFQALRYLRDPVRFMTDCHRRYGDVFTMNLGKLGTLVTLVRPDHIQEMFKSTSPSLASGQGKLLEFYVGENSLFVTEGTDHKQARGMLAPPIALSRMKVYSQLVQEATLSATRDWAPGRQGQVLDSALEAAVEVMVRAIMGLSGEESRPVRQAVREYIDGTTAPLLFFRWLRADLGHCSPGGRWHRLRARCHEVIEREIARHRDPSCRDDSMLGVLLASEEGAALPDAALRDHIFTMIMAGHESSGLTLSLAMYWLHRTPDALARLQAELDALGPEPNADALSGCAYLEATCQETLRITPIVPNIVRRLVGPLEIAGWSLPAGVRLAASAFLAPRRPETYPAPARFLPERFLDRRYKPSEFLPFGGGSFHCIGDVLALHQLKISLGTLVTRFRCEGLASPEPKIVRRGMVLMPEGGCRLLVRERRSISVPSGSAAVPG